MPHLWNELWDERGESYPNDDPIKLDGFDQSFGTITPEALSTLVDGISGNLELRDDDRLLDLGCGAGMLLSRLTPRVQIAYGTDRSSGMIQRGHKISSGMTLMQAESTHLPFEAATFDKVLAHSVFQYFDSHDYAFNVLAELLRVSKPGSRMLIGDIMDAASKKEYLEERRLSVDANRRLWKSSIEPPEHLYYCKHFFVEFASRYGLDCVITPCGLEGYQNGLYRYQVLLVRSERESRP